MSTAHSRSARTLTALGVLGVSALALSACSAGGGGASSSGFTYLGQTENTTIAATLETLSSGACADANSTSAISFDTAPGPQWDQKLQLLVGQDALPTMSMAAGTPALMQQFIDADQVVDLSAQLEKAGLEDQILPAAKSTVEALYGGGDTMYSLPTEFNIEGFWYNKQILADNGIDIPTTWDDLVDSAATLKSAGVQPFAASGKDGWPITRLVGDYIVRDLGPDALKKVADGDAKLTDPEYVAAAQEVAELGKNGYFGEAVGSVDYNASMNLFLTGKSAFFYMGSWALANFNDETQNKIGVDNIGFAAFPEVSGGSGSSDQVPANIGIPVMFSQKSWNDGAADWFSCIVDNYGDVALADSGQITGFVVDNPPSDQPALTTEVQSIIADAPSSVLWFEALFTPKATGISQQNGGALISGATSPEKFMELIQSANDEG